MKHTLIVGVLIVLAFTLGVFVSGITPLGDWVASTVFGTHGDTGVEDATVGTGSSANTPSVVPTENVTVDTSSLSDGQRKLLQTLGVDTDNFVMTPEMVACAEGKLGAARLTEIQNGATPSFFEGTALYACYKLK